MSKDVIIKEITLNDGKGGLNNRDLAANLPADQFSELENYYTDEGGFPGKKVPGAENIQYAPVGSERFELDASTVALYHLDEAAAPFVNEADVFTPILEIGDLGTTVQSPSIFSNSRRIVTASALPTFSGRVGNFLSAVNGSAFSNQIEGLGECTFDGWVNPSPGFNGAPRVMNPGAPTASNQFFSNSAAGIGVPIIATANFLSSTTLNAPANISNGLTLHRDWDFVNSKNASDIYAKFRIQTKTGTGFQVTEVSGGSITPGKWTHISGTYNAATGAVKLFVNGKRVAEAYTFGLIHDPAPTAAFDVYGYFVGGIGASYVDLTTGAVGALVTDGSTYQVYSCFVGQIDEVRISSVDRGTSFPFKKPRPRWKEFVKSNGSVQLVGPAGDGLYMTVGDGNYTLIKGGINPIANWDIRQLGDILYMCNGIDDPLAWDGNTLKPWGEGTESLIVTEQASGTGPDAGTHKFSYSYGYGGEETGLGPITTIALTGNFVTIDHIPTRHDNCSTIFIWASKAGDDTMYLVRELDNDPEVDYLTLEGPFVSNASPVDDTGGLGPADSVLGTGAYVEISAEALFTALGKPAIMEDNFDRFFLAGYENALYQMRWTEPGLPDISLPASFVVAKGSRIIQAISKSTGEVQAHKGQGGTLVLRGSDPSSWTQFENLHPNIGCVDHFGIEYRTVARGGVNETDRTILCFPAADGFYGYEGYEFYRIDDIIRKTFDSLAYRNSTRLEWRVSSQAAFESAASLGGVQSINIDAGPYLPDGLSEVPGQIRIVNQLDYIGLWHNPQGFVPTGVSGDSVIAMCKGPAEGEFFFAVSTDRKLYRTTDNWQTAAVVTDLDAVTATPVLVSEDHRIIELTYASIGGKTMIWAFTSNTSEGGYVTLWNQTDAVWENGAAALAGPYFWQADVPRKNTQTSFNDVNPNLGFFGRLALYGTLFAPGQITVGKNLYVNHDQKINIIPLHTENEDFIGVWRATTLTDSGALLLDTGGDASSILFSGANVLTSFSTTSSTNRFSITAGFFGVGEYVPNITQTNPVTLRNPSFSVEFTERETALWQGGTFRPQSIWDATSGKLFFVGSSAEDGNKNRTSNIYSLTAAAVLTAMLTDLQSYIAICSDGTSIYYTTQAALAGSGFRTSLKKFLISSGVITTISVLSDAFLPTRLSFNLNTTRIVAIGKQYDTTGADSWTFHGIISAIVPSNGAYFPLKEFTANGISGNFPAEIAYQTDAPYSHFVAMQAIQTGFLQSVYEVAAASAVAGDVTVYQATAFDAETKGVKSQMLFVPKSDVAGNNLWADRLYWSATRDTDGNGAIDDAKPVQLGVPGNWTVIGTYQSPIELLGVFDAFDDFRTDFGGDVQFSLANAALGPFASTDFQVVEPNQKITISSGTPAATAQWQAVLTWEYNLADAPTESPFIDFVNVGYFLGDADIPRIVSVHHQGRTRWAVATRGNDENNLEIIYQKNNGWTTCPGRNIITYAKFRGDLVAFVGYELARMETGANWLGEIINGRAVTGYMMNDTQDKYIRDIAAAVTRYYNRDFPTKNGWVKIRPIAAGAPLTNAEWFIPIPATADTALFPKQVQGEMVVFRQGWCRAFALEIMTSNEITGDHVPDVNQTEEIQALMLLVRLSPPRRIITVD